MAVIRNSLLAKGKLMPNKLKDAALLLKSFPSMPGAAVKLLALIDDPDMSVSQIEAILRHDAGLTANLLKLANPAYFGIPSKVGSVRQAARAQPTRLRWRPK